MLQNCEIYSSLYYMVFRIFSKTFADILYIGHTMWSLCVYNLQNVLVRNRVELHMWLYRQKLVHLCPQRRASLISTNNIFSLLCFFFTSSSLSVLVELQTLCKQYWNKIYVLEGDKWELERLNKLKEFEVKKTSILWECFVPSNVIHCSNVYNFVAHLFFAPPHAVYKAYFQGDMGHSSRYTTLLLFDTLLHNAKTY